MTRSRTAGSPDGTALAPFPPRPVRIDGERIARETLPFIGLAASLECLWDELRCFCLQLGCPAFGLIELSAGGRESHALPTGFTIPFDLDELRQLLAGTSGEAMLIDSQTLAVPVFGPLGLEAAFVVRLAVPERAAPAWSGTLSLACQLGYARYRQLAPRAQGSETALSEREREIMHWVTRGKSNAVIGSILGISPSTVDTYMRRIFKKLDVADRTSAAMRAVAIGAIA